MKIGRVSKLFLLLSGLLPSFQAFADSVVFDFKSKERAGFWTPLTDSVRGGLSTAFMKELSDESAVIFGDLSLNSEGFGFASYRVNPIGAESWSFENANQLILTAQGDGRTYRLLLKDRAARDSEKAYSWQADFTPGSEFEEIAIPLSSFRPAYRGKEMSVPGPLDVSEIFEIGIQINDGKKGGYSVLVKSLRQD